MTLDDLQTLLAERGKKTDDDAILDFYCWQKAEHWAEVMADKTHRGMAVILIRWFRRGAPKADILDVVAWLSDRDDEDLTKLIQRYKGAR
jgi:hypothetical protein